MPSPTTTPLSTAGAAPSSTKGAEPSYACAQPSRRDLPGESAGAFLSHHLPLLVGLVLVALNLRPALSSLAPLLGQVSSELGLSASFAGVVTFLPVFCLGAFAFLAPRLSHRYGSARTILLALLVLAAGVALRGVFGIAGLLLGTVMAGAGIGVAGVLLPSVVKRHYPHHASLLTGIYTMALCSGAALAAGASVPLAEAFGGSWRLGLSCWALLALAAALIWIPQLRRAKHEPKSERRRVRAPWRSMLAWQVTLYMGLQSSLAYIVFGWLPTMLMARGLGALEAGLMMSVSVLLQLVTALGGPFIAARFRHQSGVIALFLALSVVPLLCILLMPVSTLWLWIVLLGLGQGGTFSLALALLVLRTRNAQSAGALSGMAQGVGYSLASFGTLGVGLLHDLRGDWFEVAGLILAIGLLALLCGFNAGRDRFVEAG
ncbi:CynX/NimT family MFS transporter [Halotalea alkalilenta]|uniref:MFS transporter n=1 Tax=Halotalea alkalilenta TaxID=376489 RepID=A0A172YA89_9GAMM|nr:MFS transporter [Halotalea alkalilenta]ANF56066.1 MFS transporter [Halotalea alkalilenta]